MNSINKLSLLVIGALSLSAFGANNDTIILDAYNAIYANKLTSIKGECLAFDVDSTPYDYYQITVRENHENPVCTGDKNVSAKLFDMRISKLDRKVYTDQGNDSNDFREVKEIVIECGEINRLAINKQVKVKSNLSGYKIKHSGKSYFYSAPDEMCKINDTFLIKGNLVNFYAELNGFSSVIYFKKNGDTVEGWIKSDRLSVTGTGIGPVE